MFGHDAKMAENNPSSKVGRRHGSWCVIRVECRSRAEKVGEMAKRKWGEFQGRQRFTT